MSSMSLLIWLLERFSTYLLFSLEALGRKFLDSLQLGCCCNSVCHCIYIVSHKHFLYIAGEGRIAEEKIGINEHDLASSSCHFMPVWPTCALIHEIESRYSF